MDFKLNKNNLNFRVYTAVSLPSTAQENDICVISDVPMKNWIMSPDTPSDAPRTDGDVWIRYSVTGNTVNVVKTGTMMVATIAAWQYVDGVWVSKTAKSYQGGAWMGWIIPLYKAPNEYTDLTGGWTTDGFKIGTSSIAKPTKTDSGITIKGQTNVSWGIIATAKKIDVSNFNTINVRASGVDLIQIRLTTNTNLSDDASGFYGKYDIPVTDGLATLSLANVSGSYYIAIFNNMTLTEVYAT